MRLNPVELIGGFNRDSALVWAAQDVVNWIPEIAEGQNRSRIKLANAPGLKPFLNLGAAPGRGLHNCQGKLFVVNGSSLLEVKAAGGVLDRGVIPGVQRVAMQHNQRGTGNQLLIANGSAGYVWNTTTSAFTRITDPGYPGARSVDFVDGYLVQVEPSGRYLFHSELTQATEYNTLDRFESETSPDRIVTARVNQREVVAFNQTTIDFFANTGAATGTFRNKGISIDRGCASRYGVLQLDNSLMWLGNDGIFYRLDGYSARPISTGPVEKAIKDYNWAQAFTFTLESQHHKIGYWTFPDGKTFGYDVITGLWHRRSSYGLDRWRVNGIVEWNGKWIADDYTNGNLYEVDWDTFDECGQLIERDMITPVLHDNGNYLGVLRVDVLFATGGPRHVTEPLPQALVLSGDLPGGSLDDVISFQYIATGGTGAITFALVSGVLPTGLSMSSSGLVTGTITAGGTFNWTVRAQDSVGVFAELPDSATFVAPLKVVAVGEITNGNHRLQTSINGKTFGSPPIAPSPAFDIPRILVTNTGRWISIGPASTSLRYSDNQGLTWTIVEVPTMGTTYSLAKMGGILMIAAGAGAAGILRSTNDGLAWTVTASGLNASVLCATNSLAVALLSSTAPTYSVDLGLTWSTPGAALSSLPDAFSGLQAKPATDGTRIVFGGQAFQSGVGSVPAVAVTQDGITFTIRRLRLTNNGIVSSVGYGRDVWLAGLETGEIYRSTDNCVTWTQVATMGVRVRAIVDNGASFVAVGSASGVGAIMHSDVGLTWANSTHPFAYAATDIAVIP